MHVFYIVVILLVLLSFYSTVVSIVVSGCSSILMSFFLSLLPFPSFVVVYSLFPLSWSTTLSFSPFIDLLLNNYNIFSYSE